MMSKSLIRTDASGVVVVISAHPLPPVCKFIREAFSKRGRAAFILMYYSLPSRRAVLLGFIIIKHRC
jgi:hypothetical protein